MCGFPKMILLYIHEVKGPSFCIFMRLREPSCIPNGFGFLSRRITSRLRIDTLFLVIEKLLVGSTLDQIFWFRVNHNVTVGFTIIPAPVVAGRMSRIKDHIRSIVVCVGIKSSVPNSLMLNLVIGFIG